MSGATAVAGTVQIVGGIALAPLLPGLVQHWKARLQGRRGPTPLQPYRELRRLWGKSAVDPEGTVRQQAATGEEVLIDCLDLDAVSRARTHGTFGLNRPGVSFASRTSSSLEDVRSPMTS